MNRILPIAGLLALAAFSLLFVTDMPLYFGVIDLWSFHPEVEPFFDLSGPLAWIPAWRAGADVYRVAPAGAHGWLMNYSPLFLRLPLPWVGAASVPAYGLSLDALFLLSLAVLPRPRAARDGVAMLLALFSPLCVFGLERANLDLLMFAMVAVAVVWLGRGAVARGAGYALIVAAGALKFYPWALLLLLARERLLAFLAAGALATALLAAFVVGYRDELTLVAANLTPIIPFTDAFGASQLANGVVFITHPLHAVPGRWDPIDVAVWASVTLGAYGAALASGLRFGRDARLRGALARLSARERLCLSAGAALMCGCFFAGGSVGYRAVHALFALPGILALARVADEPGFARRVRGIITATLLLLWSLPIQRLVVAVFGNFWIVGVGLTTRSPMALAAGASFWLLREALWWWLMTFLIAVFVSLLRDSPVWTSAARRLTGVVAGS